MVMVTAPATTGFTCGVDAVREEGGEGQREGAQWFGEVRGPVQLEVRLLRHELTDLRVDAEPGSDAPP